MATDRPTIPRQAREAEDYRGNYWTTERTPTGRVLTRPCSDPTCLWTVTIQRDGLGRWFARHEHSDRDPILRRGPSTVSTRRYRDWQDAAAEAIDRGWTDGD